MCEEARETSGNVFPTRPLAARRGNPAIGYMPQTRAAPVARFTGRDFVASAVHGERWGVPLAGSGNRRDIDWSPSTVRAELAALEEEGFLTHPHTSAGRVPTDSGYRFYVEQLLERQDRLPQPSSERLGLSRMRREVDAAIRDTTTALSQVTDLVALVTAPPLHTATIHRIEVLRLQPRVVMVVVIASNGGVTVSDRLQLRPAEQLPPRLGLDRSHEQPVFSPLVGQPTEAGLD